MVSKEKNQPCSSSLIITRDINIMRLDKVTMVPHSASKTSTKGLWLKENWKRAVEILVLSGVILLVCGLFTIPTIFYALPPLQVRSRHSSSQVPY